MDRVEALVTAYRRQLALPWRRDLSGPERVWMLVYPPDIELRLRRRVGEFEIETKEAGRNWRLLDLTKSFADWLGTHDYREAYFEEPTAIKPALAGYAQRLQETVRDLLTADGVDQDTIVAITGIGALFPMARVSDLVQRTAGDIRGRLLVLFPGTFEKGNYRLLDARDGWNYLAIPITIPDGGSR